MLRPILRNYFPICCIQRIGELWKVLHSEKSIFVRSWNRVHSCKFFLNNDKTYTIKRLEEMIRAGEFWQVIHKEDAKKQRIRFALLDLQEKTTMFATHSGLFMTVEQAAKALNDFGKAISNTKAKFNLKKDEDIKTDSEQTSV